MPMQKDEREKRIATIKELIEAGYSIADLAKHFTVREENIRIFLRNHGLKTKGQRDHEERSND